MGEVVVFDLPGPLAHFRRPDTFATHATYPFMPRTALRGLIGGVLGLEYREEGDILTPEDRCGLRLLSPVQTVAQELSLHGKKWLGGGGDDSFHRPTSIELIVEPRYRVYYSGPKAQELAERLERSESVFHTYLGCAYCLTFPKWVGRREAVPIWGETLRSVTVLPGLAIEKLTPEQGAQYARVGGMSREHIGSRRFRGAMSVVYERTGRSIAFVPASISSDDWLFVEVAGEGTVCLW